MVKMIYDGFSISWKEACLAFVVLVRFDLLPWQITVESLFGEYDGPFSKHHGLLFPVSYLSIWDDAERAK